MNSFPNVKKKDDKQSPSKSNDEHLPSKSDNEQLPLKSQEPMPKPMKTNKITYVKEESPEEYDKNIKKRIEMVLKKASAGGEPITYYQYEMAVVQQPRKGSEVLLRRDIDEIFMSNYNPEWMEVWDANHDLSPVYDWYGVITYVTDYFTKDSTGLTDVLKAGMKQMGREGDMRQKCNALA